LRKENILGVKEFKINREKLDEVDETNSSPYKSRVFEEDPLSEEENL